MLACEIFVLEIGSFLGESVNNKIIEWISVLLWDLSSCYCCVWGSVLYCSEKSDQLEDSQASRRGATFCTHPHSRRQHIIYSETFAERMCVDDDFYIYAIVHCLWMESVWGSTIYFIYPGVVFIHSRLLGGQLPSHRVLSEQNLDVLFIQVKDEASVICGCNFQLSVVL